ncbi:hypothetical protein C5167_022143 [Papaver somniferum]|uniref:Uncharacterized protein n=1 Tax=Papaver somniferum TaxID=3469 RepID=A0A4Y7JGZ7_PAPSO|nr:hypothetical protein C5167_022143 [Papaver somniferum]
MKMSISCKSNFSTNAIESLKPWTMLTGGWWLDGGAVTFVEEVEEGGGAMAYYVPDIRFLEVAYMSFTSSSSEVASKIPFYLGCLSFGVEHLDAYICHTCNLHSCTNKVAGEDPFYPRVLVLG